MLASVPGVDEEQVACHIDPHVRAILPSQHRVGAPECEQLRVHEGCLAADALVSFSEVEFRVEKSLFRLRVGDLALVARVFESCEPRDLVTAALRHDSSQFRLVIREVVEARRSGELLTHEEHGRVGQ